MNENKTLHFTVKAPCDLYGVNARLLNHAIKNNGGVLFIEKPQENKSCRATSLLELLKLDVRKGDTIRFITQDAGHDVSDIVSTLNGIAS